jgi:hypothetical protein
MADVADCQRGRRKTPGRKGRIFERAIGVRPKPLRHKEREA